LLGNDPAAVKSFVSEMGDKMNYRVALDDASAGERTGKMAKTWMMAAGESGIPTAFLIDKESHIAWIGHPMQLDRALESYKAGKLDGKKEAAKRKAEKALEKELSASMRSRDYTKALQTLDAFTKENPELAGGVGAMRYSFLLRAKDYPGALAEARKLADSAKDEEQTLNMVAWSMVDEDSKFENPDLDVALRCAQRAHELAPQDANIADTLAHVHAARGEMDKAIELETQAATNAEGSSKQQFEKAVEQFKSKQPAPAK